tara:strand:- start:190 stop:360 length:171 start_codon:yes stop_codon:yes gene_type:complete
MKKVSIVLRNGHGGELDRHDFRVRPDQIEEAVIGNETIRCIEGWTLNVGDSIKIEA